MGFLKPKITFTRGSSEVRMLLLRVEGLGVPQKGKLLCAALAGVRRIHERKQSSDNIIWL